MCNSWGGDVDISRVVVTPVLEAEIVFEEGGGGSAKFKGLGGRAGGVAEAGAVVNGSGDGVPSWPESELEEAALVLGVVMFVGVIEGGVAPWFDDEAEDDNVDGDEGIFKRKKNHIR